MNYLTGVTNTYKIVRCKQYRGVCFLKPAKIILCSLLTLIVTASVGGYITVTRLEKNDSPDNGAAAGSAAETARPSVTEKADESTGAATPPASESASARPEKSTAAPASTTKKPAAQEEPDYGYPGLKPVIVNLGESDWNLLLVNRHYKLPDSFNVSLAPAVSGYDPAGYTQYERNYLNTRRLDARVSPHYTAMFNAAEEDGITLLPYSGYRGIQTQKTNFENKINYYKNQGYSAAQATRLAAEIILPPGCSEHNAGLAMDICNTKFDFQYSKEYKWLLEHAADYGFILRYPQDKEKITELTFEPWHWRYVGVEHAKAIKEGGLCLEEYLKAR